MKNTNVLTAIACLAMASVPVLAQDAPKPNPPQPSAEQIERMHRMVRETAAKAQARPKEKEAKPWRLGLMVEPIEATLRNHLDLPEKTGVTVTECMAGGPAAKAGIKKNDIIVAVNGRPVGSIAPLRDSVMESAKTGKELRLTTVQKGQRREVTIKPEMPKPPVERATREAPPTPPNPAIQREQEMMMRRMAEQNNKLMERLERQEGEMKRLREQVEQMTKAMREMKRDGDKDKE